MEELTIELNKNEICYIYGGERRNVYTLDENGYVMIRVISI